MNDTATATAETLAQEQPAQTIEYGGLIWTHTGRLNSLEYEVKSAEIGCFRIYQYPEDGTGCDGRWLWSAKLTDIFPESFLPKVFDVDCSHVVGTDINEAMQACLDARDKLIEDIRTLSMYFGIGNYATGYMDGQAALAKKIAQVLP